MKALPDLEIEVQHRHFADDAVLVEVIVRDTHLGAWRGLPATGRRVEFPLCGVYTFDSDDRLGGEKIYYDRGTVLRQLGVFHEPPTLLGQICILATHPITVARAFASKFLCGVSEDADRRIPACGTGLPYVQDHQRERMLRQINSRMYFEEELASRRVLAGFGFK